MEAAFKTLEVAAKKLNNDAKKFRDSLSALLNHQLEFGTILGDVYMPANMGGRAGGKRGGDDDEGGHGVSMPIRVGWQLPTYRVAAFSLFKVATISQFIGTKSGHSSPIDKGSSRFFKSHAGCKRRTSSRVRFRYSQSSSAHYRLHHHH